MRPCMKALATVKININSRSDRSIVHRVGQERSPSSFYSRSSWRKSRAQYGRRWSGARSILRLSRAARKHFVLPLHSVDLRNGPLDATGAGLSRRHHRRTRVPSKSRPSRHIAKRQRACGRARATSAFGGPGAPPRDGPRRVTRPRHPGDPPNVPARLDQQRPRPTGPCFRDGPAMSSLGGAVFSRHQAEIRRRPPRVRKAVDLIERRAIAQRGHPPTPGAVIHRRATGSATAVWCAQARPPERAREAASRSGNGRRASRTPRQVDRGEPPLKVSARRSPHADRSPAPTTAAD